MLARYRSALRATIAASAAPYGYTLTVWTSGAVLSHARGIPSAAEALLFLGGAPRGVWPGMDRRLGRGRQGRI